ncbi:MAG: hypothetical protein GPJ52_00030 [Candidatus Heimdallarchaeota archaeon]|nr:hypothetical protein [Candidatus Heimdallarchaeota archaeon]
MTEQQIEKGLEITLVTSSAKIKVQVMDLTELNRHDESLFRIADQCDKLNNLFKIREKYLELFTLIPKGLLIHWNDENWKDWEKALLLMFLNYPYATERQAIWDCGIDANNLRQIIHQKSDLIEVLQENKLALTLEGLKVIKKKLDNELINCKKTLKVKNNE